MSVPLNPSSSTRTKKEELGPGEETEGMLYFNFSNQTVLMVTCMSFLLFVIGEIIGAIAGNSWSLLGDAAAMSVDVVSYFCNMIAERIKSGGGVITPRVQMILEVYVPSTSVAMLIGVTIYVTVGAVNDIITPPEDDTVDIFMLWLFSSLNAVVDIVSGYMFFAKGRGVLYETINDGDDMDDEDKYHILEGDDEEVLQKRPEEHKNLNMISALTHVGGDTLRTLSVFIAAAIATASNTPGYLCDAWAAVFVSLTIVITIMPLLSEIFRAYKRISAKMA
jgi:Co/Zn/Cd efflux system component